MHAVKPFTRVRTLAFLLRVVAVSAVSSGITFYLDAARGNYALCSARSRSFAGRNRRGGLVYGARCSSISVPHNCHAGGFSDCRAGFLPGGCHRRAAEVLVSAGFRLLFSCRRCSAIILLLAREGVARKIAAGNRNGAFSLIEP